METKTKEFYKWKDEYSVGIEVIDDQHKQLLKVINKLYTAFSLKKNNENLELFLNELSEYAKTHFKTEEQLFDLYNYKDKVNHVTKHKEFIDKITRFHNKTTSTSVPSVPWSHHL